jgi:hypothetical protein
MKKEALTFLISFIALLLIALSLTPACTPIQPAITPDVPKAPVAQPPAQAASSENQSAVSEETPPVTAPADEETWYPVTTFSGIISETTPVFHIYGTEWRLTWTIEAENLDTAVFKIAIYPEGQPFNLWQTVSNDGLSTGTVNYFMSYSDKRDLFIKVTAFNVKQWNIDMEDNANAATAYPVFISSIHYRGTVFPPDPENGFCYERVEPDEYVVIKNLSSCYVDMTGWQLKNISKPSPVFKFPPLTIFPGGIIRVYTDECNTSEGCLTFYYGFGDIWSNDHSDIAVLYDALGNEVSRKTYLIPTPMNSTEE